MASGKRAKQGYGRWCAFAPAQMMQCLSGRDTPKRLADIHKLRKHGAGINKIARKLGIGVSVVQRVVAGRA
jgi:hypothetical protein